MAPCLGVGAETSERVAAFSQLEDLVSLGSGLQSQQRTKRLHPLLYSG